MEDQRTPVKIGDSLAWINLLVTVVGLVVVVARTLEIAGCGDQCNFSVLEVVTRAFWITSVLVFIATTVSYFILKSRFARAWLLPAAGITITLIALIITNAIMGEALSVP